MSDENVCFICFSSLRGISSCIGTLKFNMSVRVRQVLKHLTVKRPVEASRLDFFAHAEAFASLVNLEFVSITGKYLSVNYSVPFSHVRFEYAGIS